METKNKPSIAYQNKDIVSKILAENFKSKSLGVYGLDLPRIVRALPTNLPEISANELRIDHIFELEDQDYIVLLPLDQDGNDNEEGEVFIYRYHEDDDGNPSLENIENDDEYEAVTDRFDELLDEAEWDSLLGDD